MYPKLDLAILLALICCSLVCANTTLGGLEEEKPADDNVRRIVDRVQQNIKSKYPREYTRIEPISYRTQLVNGLNYYIKVAITESDGSKKFAHLRIYESFQGDTKLGRVKPNVGEKDALKYFK